MTNLPAYLQNFRRGAASESLDSLTKMALGTQPYISIQGNRFRAIDAVGDEQMIGDIDRKTGLAFCEVVIVDANDHVSKVYYASDFDPKATEYMPPTCWSDNGVAPSSQAQTPQCRSCAECPKAVWGSATSKLTGKQTKACNDVKKIAVYVPGFAGAFLLRIPPASLKHLADHARKIIGNGASVAHVITRISFEPEGVGMLNFTPVGWISEQMMTAIDDLEGAKLDMLVGRNDKPRVGELPAPEKQQAIGHQQGNGTAPPSNAGMFDGRQQVAPQVHQEIQQHTPVGQPQETEIEKMRREMAELQAKLNAQMQPSEAVKPQRTRRTKAEMEAAKAAEARPTPEQGQDDMFGAGPNVSTGNAQEKMEVPAFLNGGVAGATAPVGPTGGAAAARMQTPAEPPADLAAALDAAFKL